MRRHGRHLGAVSLGAVGRKLPRSAEALTALAANEEDQRALQAGYQLHLAKPVGAARLTAVAHGLANWK